MNEQAPVVIISQDQGIPIPDNDFTFTLTRSQYEIFSTKEISVKGTPVKDVFVIAMSRDSQLSINLLLNDKERIDSTSLIGAFCQLRGVDESPFQNKIHCRVFARTKIVDYTTHGPSLYTSLQIVDERLLPGEDDLLKDLRLLIDIFVSKEDLLPKEIRPRIKKTKDVTKVCNILAEGLSLNVEEKYNYLQFLDNLDRYTLILRHLVDLMEKTPIPSSRKKKLPAIKSKSPKDPIPASFMNLFQDLEKTAAEQQNSYNDATASKFTGNFPEKIKSKIDKESRRLRNLPPASMEYQTVQEYLDWLTNIPFGEFSNEPPNLKTFTNTLDSSHYGLPDVKEHILEYMTIEKLAKSSKGTVLCFSGPQGTGKTSIVKQIAEATNRKIIKIALGGMSDEAEIRGHRRTYVAAKPGRIINGLVNCKTMDPLILLDEVDKTSDSSRGDPIAALLEVLDPEQNNEFIDRFIEEPVDLSKAMFICTANYMENIPAPLLDRLEIVHFREYEEDEKLVIAEKFILPKVKIDYCLTEMNISFTDCAIRAITDGHGIRDVERRIRKLFRNAAVAIEVKGEESVSFSGEKVKEIFKKYSLGKKNIGFK